MQENNYRVNQHSLKTTISRVEKDKIITRGYNQRDLIEKIRYSDPMTNESAADIEKDIVTQLDALRGEVLDNDAEAALKRIKEIDYLINHRNSVCLRNKSAR